MQGGYSKLEPSWSEWCCSFADLAERLSPSHRNAARPLTLRRDIRSARRTIDVSAKLRFALAEVLLALILNTPGPNWPTLLKFADRYLGVSRP